MTARTPLPPRRPSVSLEAEFRRIPITITVGFDTAGAPREVFAGTAKSGSDMAATLADACVLISIALQHDVTVDALAKSLGRVPAFRDGEETVDFASPIGVVVAAIQGC